MVKNSSVKLVEIDETDALDFLIGSKVSSVQSYPAADLAATIVHYSSGLQWIRFKRHDGAYAMKWYVPDSYIDTSVVNNVQTTTPIYPAFFSSPPDPVEQDEPAELEVAPRTGPPQEWEAVEPDNTPVNKTINPDKPEYLRVVDLDMKSAVFQEALKDTSLDDLRNGRIRRDVYDAAYDRLTRVAGEITAAEPRRRGRKRAN